MKKKKFHPIDLVLALPTISAIVYTVILHAL